MYPPRRRLTGARLVASRPRTAANSRSGNGRAMLPRGRRTTPLSMGSSGSRSSCSVASTRRSSRPSGNRSTWRPIVFFATCANVCHLGTIRGSIPSVATTRAPSMRRHHARVMIFDIERGGAARRAERRARGSATRIRRPCGRGCRGKSSARRPILFCSNRHKI